MLLLIIYQAICVLQLSNVKAYECQFKTTPLHEMRFEKDQSNFQSTYTRTNNKTYKKVPINIHFEYTTTFLKQSNSKYIINILNTVKLYFKNILYVKRTNRKKKLVVSRDCINNDIIYVGLVKTCLSGCNIPRCNEVTIPENFLKKCFRPYNQTFYVESGIEGASIPDTDLIFIVDNFDCDYNNLMISRSCFHDEWDRPILGTIRICTKSIKKYENPRFYITLLKHEIIHSLGFDYAKFAFFRYSSGEPIVERKKNGNPYTDTVDGIYSWNKIIARSIWRKHFTIDKVVKRSFISIQLPLTLQRARDYFGCPKLDGVDMENHEEPIDRTAHFDELVYGPEIMTKDSNFDLDTLSILTLSFLEETGWYESVYSYAEKMIYGNFVGCTIAFNGCYLYILDSIQTNISLAPFCNFAANYGRVLKCRDRDFFVTCDLTKYSGSKPDYMYFKSFLNIKNEDVKFYYGNSENAAFCPRQIVIYPVGKQSSTCYDDFNNKLPSFELYAWQNYYGYDSECFESNILNPTDTLYYGAACHKVKTINESHFTIYLNNHSYICQYGKTIQAYAKKFNVRINCGTRVVGSRLGRPKYAEIIKINYLNVLFIYLFAYYMI